MGDTVRDRLHEEDPRGRLPGDVVDLGAGGLVERDAEAQQDPLLPHAHGLGKHARQIGPAHATIGRVNGQSRKALCGAYVTIDEQLPWPPEGYDEQQLCPQCRGLGELITAPCRVCRGAGRSG